MDRSALRYPDPFAPLRRERRRTVRQRLHTPVYVSFNTPQSGAVVDLSELLDLNENGFAVQTALPTVLHSTDRLEVNHAVSLCLDLPETRKFVHASGQVMWTDDTGRAGIRFSFLPDSSRQVLKEWLFANLLVASTNHAARTSQLAHQQEAFGSTPSHTPETPAAAGSTAQASVEEGRALTSPSEQSSIPHQAPAGTSDAPELERAQLLSALDDMRRQIAEIKDAGVDRNLHAGAVLHFIAERAASFTGASGVALALLTRGKIICRASLGEPAPPVGSEVDAGSGLSGECLRHGTLVSCLDTESDPRVDPEVCRGFGIGSFMAAPIFADFRVVGLIEVFSPYPQTFDELHETVLERLAELVPFTPDEPANNKIEAREEKAHHGPLVPPETAPHRTAGAENGQIGTEPVETRRTATGIDAEHEAILERIFERTPERTFERTPERATEPVLDRRAEQASVRAAEPGFEEVIEDNLPARRLPFSHLVLLVLTIAVAAMALGYLLAPTIEAFWQRRAQAARRSPGAADPSSSSNPSDRRRALSPAELRQLAEQGDADAQWHLGILYDDGDVVPKDDALAVQWFQRAAEQGYVRAQTTLGAYYYAGRGVPQDYSKAYFWSLLALAQGDKDSKLRLEGLSTQMTRAEVASARQQAEAWLHAHNQSAGSKPN